MDIRVLHLSSGNLYGGVERILSSLAARRALCPAMRPSFGLAFDGRQASELRSAGIEPHVLGAVRVSRPLSVVRARRALERVLQVERPDVVVYHNPWPLVVFGPAVDGRALPSAVWVHGALRGRNWLERWAARRTPDIVIANSRYTKMTVGSVFRNAPVDVVYAPVEFARPIPGARASTRRALGIADGKVMIIQVSRVEETKGHADHLAALARLKDDPRWVAVFVGGAQQAHERVLMKELQRLAADLGIADRVHFLGERRDIDALLAGADVFCQPNPTPEAFGLTFVEALAAGLPVVTSAIGGAMEIIDSSCGVLLPPGDIEALASALRGLLDEPGRRANLAAAGPPRAHFLCDPRRSLSSLHEVLRRVVSPRAGSAESVPCSR